MDVAVGQVILLGDGRRGTIRYVGPTYFAPGEWVGVELETTTGKNDGSVQGERYFDCAMGRGMFLRPSAVTIVAAASDADDDDDGDGGDGDGGDGNDGNYGNDGSYGEETPAQLPKAMSAARHSSVSSTGGGRKTATGSRPSSVFATGGGNRTTSGIGADAGLARRMSMNAPSPSPRPRSRPSSIARVRGCGACLFGVVCVLGGDAD